MKFRDKKLRRLAEQDDSRGLPTDLVPRIRDILLLLKASQSLSSIGSRPSFRLHPLKGSRREQWSIRVSGNWRIVFRFVDGEAVDVDLVDYH